MSESLTVSQQFDITVSVSFQIPTENKSTESKHQTTSHHLKCCEARSMRWTFKVQYLLRICQLTYFWSHAGNWLQQAAICGLKKCLHIWCYWVQIKFWSAEETNISQSMKHWFQLLGTERLSWTQYSIWNPVWHKLCKHKAKKCSTIWKHIPVYLSFHLRKETMVITCSLRQVICISI